MSAPIQLTRPDLTAVQGYLTSQGVEVTGELSAQLIAGGRSNLTYVLSDENHRWVLRRPPVAGRTPSAHDVAREFRVTRGLEGSGVPVAATVAFCDDESVLGSPFTVVEFVEGHTIRTQDDLAELDDAGADRCVQGLVEVFATLHAIDPVEVGLGDFGRPDGYAERQLRRWSSQWELVREQPGKDASRLADRLRESIPAQRYSSIVHGDYRIDNTLVALGDPGRIAAVVDWELSTLGDPVADVAMMCAYRHPGLDLVLGTEAAWTSDRLPAVPDLAAAYEAAGAVRLDHWEFHMGLAFFKLAVISAGIAHRHRAGAATGDGFDTAGDAVAGFLTEGLAWMDAS